MLKEIKDIKSVAKANLFVNNPFHDDYIYHATMMKVYGDHIVVAYDRYYNEKGVLLNSDSDYNLWYAPKLICIANTIDECQQDINDYDQMYKEECGKNYDDAYHALESFAAALQKIGWENETKLIAAFKDGAQYSLERFTDRYSDVHILRKTADYALDLLKTGNIKCPECVIPVSSVTRVIHCKGRIDLYVGDFGVKILKDRQPILYEVLKSYYNI